MTRPSRTPQRLHLLALAIAVSLACSASAAWAQTAGPIIADGDHQVAVPGAYATTDDGVAGYVFHALNGGSIRADGPVTITDMGSDTAALRAERDGWQAVGADAPLAVQPHLKHPLTS